MIKAIFFDIDGTLLSHKSKRVPESTINAFHQLRENGILLFAATGRHILEMEQLPLEGIRFDGFITLNGQLNLDENQEIIDENPIHREDTAYMIKLFNEKTIPIMIVEKNRMYINYSDEQVEEAQKLISTPVPETGSYEGEKIYQFVIYDREDRAKEIQKHLPNCAMIYWNNNALDVIPKIGGKSVGIGNVIEKLGIQTEETMAFGDGHNDIDMLRFVGIGVAMGNSSEEVKKAADYVTEDIDQDGLYKALKKFNLI